MGRRRAIETALVICAAAGAVAPIPPLVVERWYSTGLYPNLQRVITPIGNLVPFAWFDVLLLVVVVTTLTLLVRAGRLARRDRTWRPLLERTWTLLASAAVLYLVFLGLWGMNYRRVSMSQRLELNNSLPGRDDIVQLGITAVDRLNSLYTPAHRRGWAEDEWHDQDLVRAFGDAKELVEDTPRVVPGRLKQTILGPYFRWTGVDGMVNPFALEVLVNPDLLPWERPFVAAHEWSHLAGFAEESDASFVGWLACLRGNDAAQYSGWLFLYWEVSGNLAGRDRQTLNDALTDGPKRDVTAVVDRLRRSQVPSLRNASWAVYDEYLRANRVEEGIRSYGEVVTLILRARFDDGYRPVRRIVHVSSR